MGCSLRVWMKCWRVVGETSTIRAMDALETRLRRSSWISCSLPSSLDFPKAPLGRPRRLPLAFAAMSPSLGPFSNEIALDLGKEAKEGEHGFGLQGLFALKADRFLNGHEPNPLLPQVIDDLQNLPQASPEA